MQTDEAARPAPVTRLLWAIAAAALAAPLLLVFRGPAELPDKPFVEDAFYALSVARQLGTGHGFTIDGLTPTNGVQPLYVLLMAPFYALTGGDRVGTLRLVLAFEWGCWIAAALGAARLARRWWGEGAPAWLAPATVLLWAGSVHLWRQSFNGLETGLALALLAWSAVAYLGLDRARVAPSLRFGALLGLAVLARIDAVFVVIAFAAAELLRHGASGRVARAASISVTAAVVSSPWWIYNQAVFGSVMPTSGQATAGSHFGEWGTTKLMFDAMASGVAPYAWVSRWEGPLAQAIRGAIAVTVLVVALRSLRARRDPSLAALAGVWLAFVVALGAWYLCRSRMNFFYPRYLVPGAVLGVPVAAVWAARAVVSRPWIAALGGAALAASAGACAVFVTGGAGNVMYRHQVQLVLREVPTADRVAAQQSGTLGYFRDGVVNLDGKVNPGALAERGMLEAYLRRTGVTWFCDDRGRAAGTLGRNPATAGWTEVASSGAFALWRRE